MTGLDTNVVVRYLTQDDRVQSPIATRHFEGKLTEREPGFISVVAMVETVWVLERAYGARRAALAAAIEGLLQTDSLMVQCEQDVFAAMVTLKSGAGSFADGLIAALGARAGCTSTVTFDRDAAKVPGFTLLGS